MNGGVMRISVGVGYIYIRASRKFKIMDYQKSHMLLNSSIKL